MNNNLLDVRDKDITELYSDWNWLIDPFELKTPLLMTQFGDLFFQEADEKVYCLDTVKGHVVFFAENLVEMNTKLNMTNIQDNFQHLSLITNLISQGITLTPDELYSFKTPPVLGGKIELDNVEKMNNSVSLSISGQLHKQVKDLPPGSKIDSIQID